VSTKTGIPSTYALARNASPARASPTSRRAESTMRSAAPLASSAWPTTAAIAIRMPISVAVRPNPSATRSPIVCSAAFRMPGSWWASMTRSSGRTSGGAPPASGSARVDWGSVVTTRSDTSREYPSRVGRRTTSLVPGAGATLPVVNDTDGPV
jgi:hypothetical protein